jgi:hypothetical protein
LVSAFGGSGRSGGIFNGLPGHNPGKAGVYRRLREMLTCICVVFRASDPGDGTASDMKCVVARGFRPILSHPWLLAAAVYRLGSTPISHPPRLIVARGHRPPRCREPGCRRALHARRHHSFRPRPSRRMRRERGMGQICEIRRYALLFVLVLEVVDHIGVPVVIARKTTKLAGPAVMAGFDAPGPVETS